MDATTISISSQSDLNEIAKQVNKVRLANKNKWYQITFVNDTTKDKTHIKCFDTWVQIGQGFNSSMDCNVEEFKNNIINGVKAFLAVLRAIKN